MSYKEPLSYRLGNIVFAGLEPDKRHTLLANMAMVAGEVTGTVAGFAGGVALAAAALQAPTLAAGTALGVATLASAGVGALCKARLIGRALLPLYRCG